MGPEATESDFVSGALVRRIELPLKAKEQTSPLDQEFDGDNRPANTKPTVVIKIEEEEDEGEGEGEGEGDDHGEDPGFNDFTVTSMADCSSGGSSGRAASSSSSAAEALPRPMEGLHEVGLPPFLKKTYEMVEDPASDAVVSWSRNGKSFVVWDQHEFSKDLLPKYFKHNNFSSFIRQLNTYGFRKIDSDRWDFAHEFFQRGKKPLLNNIRRRARASQSHPRRAGMSLTISENKRTVDVEAQAEIMKKDGDELRLEIFKLRQEQEISQNEISAIEERIRRAENRHQHMFLFLAKAVRNPNFVQQLIQKKRSSDPEMRQLKMAGGHSKKRPRLQMPIDPEAAEFLIEVMKPNLSDDNQESGGFPASGDGEVTGCELGQEPRNGEITPSEPDCVFSDMSEVYQVVSDNLLGDIGNVENEEIAEALKDSNLYLEFEGLIRKSRDWEGYEAEFLEPAAVGAMP
ncbi:heat stress transcription factor A-2c-like [Punica granatum]|uniref:HSF-type DNA-binding domain-containing protein n=3 Tax=Punica granatum TaxID=22663 RepID=A0A218XEG4_PUNGR|nr:heat stress transcription factor A-2c-like [Punica granatum]OWM83130.1 hypothetical protein CDL15_Pgr011812 [Punica granatum]PKI44355.1 hypothetical protein CRG98_035266 [Punica granatum]